MHRFQTGNMGFMQTGGHHLHHLHSQPQPFMHLQYGMYPSRQGMQQPQEQHVHHPSSQFHPGFQQHYGQQPSLQNAQFSQPHLTGAYPTRSVAGQPPSPQHDPRAFYYGWQPSLLPFHQMMGSIGGQQQGVDGRLTQPQNRTVGIPISPAMQGLSAAHTNSDVSDASRTVSETALDQTSGSAMLAEDFESMLLLGQSSYEAAPNAASLSFSHSVGISADEHSDTRLKPEEAVQTSEAAVPVAPEAVEHIEETKRIKIIPRSTGALVLARLDSEDSDSEEDMFSDDLAEEDAAGPAREEGEEQASASNSAAFEGLGTKKTEDNYNTHGQTGHDALEEPARIKVDRPPPPPRLLQKIAYGVDDLLHDELLAAESEGLRKFALAAAVEKEIQQFWPAARIQVYGSTVTRIAIRGSADVDMCLLLNSDSLDAGSESVSDDIRSRAVRRLGRYFINRGFSKVLALPEARVPVVKFQHPDFLDLNADLCIENRNALKNTAMIRDLLDRDRRDRIRMLCLLVKHFAKQRRINDPFRGTLSSYAYVLMVLSFSYKTGLLPNPQQSDESVASLLAAFFKFFAHEFEYRTSVLTLRYPGGVISKDERGWPPSATAFHGKHRKLIMSSNEDGDIEMRFVAAKVRPDNYYFCIEDPIEIDHNLGRMVSVGRLKRIRGDFMRACEILRRYGDVVGAFREYVPEKIGDVAEDEASKTSLPVSNNTENRALSMQSVPFPNRHSDSRKSSNHGRGFRDPQSQPRGNGGNQQQQRHHSGSGQRPQAGSVASGEGQPNPRTHRSGQSSRR
eukprot:ANDGO_01471.mRNA.1 UTP:RNA uridylyltransferase 1